MTTKTAVTWTPASDADIDEDSVGLIYRYELVLDLRDGRMFVRSYHRSNTARSFDEVHGHVRTWGLAHLPGKTYDRIMERALPHAQALVDAYGAEWDGRNVVASLDGLGGANPDAEIARLTEGWEETSYEWVVRAAESAWEAAYYTIVEAADALIAEHARTRPDLPALKRDTYDLEFEGVDPDEVAINYTTDESSITPDELREAYEKALPALHAYLAGQAEDEDDED